MTDGARSDGTDTALRPDGRVRRPDGAGRRRPTRARAAGYRRMDAYSPFPIEELSEALGLHDEPAAAHRAARRHRRRLGGYGLQYWASVIDYPLNIGGRPLQQLAGVHPGHVRVHDPAARRSRPCSACSALNGLPQPYHPVFNVPRFAERARRPVLPRASRPTIRSSIATGRARSCRAWSRESVNDVAP